MFDRLGMAIRLRDPWEAVDLGFILLRAHWRTVMLAWLAVTLPLSVLLYVVFWHHLWVPPLVLWWLKPLLDRVVLHVLAKATFGEIPDLPQTLKHAPKFLRRGLVATLLWRRFSPQRSFVLPVWQLEEQPGEDFRKRCAVLLRKGRTQAIFLTFVCFLFQFVVFFGALAGLEMFTPKGADFGVMDAVFGSGSDRIHWVDIFLSLLPLVAFTLLEPFYVAGGFSLYLNRRVELEGWDLEVAFRKIAERFTKLLGRSLAVLLVLFALTASIAWCAQPQPSDPKEALIEVLKQPEFQVKQKKKGLHWKGQASSTPPKDSSPSPNLLGLLKALGTLAKWVIIALAATALCYVLWRNRRYLMRHSKITSEEKLPETLFGMDIRPEALPANLDGVAARLWAEGQIRAALALLYRGALAHLVHRHRGALSRGATEGDCLRKAREILPQAAADYFGRLTRTWLQVAYAGLEPLAGSETLCTEWAQHFRETASEARP
jgi:hypothetical protein